MEMGGKVLIVAGEASGDGYAARVVKYLQKIRPAVDVYGVGGDCLRETGARLMVDIKKMSTFGVFEVFKAIPRLARIFFGLLGSIKRENPDLVILVDYPDFNLRLARFIRWRYGRSLKILYYITPQVWIWRKRRAKTLARLVDQVVVVFPFEEPIFKSLGVKTDFVGHPLMETISTDMDREKLRQKYNLPPDKKVIALLPGSRHGEIENYLPEMIEAARELNREGDFTFLLARAATISEEDISVHLAGNEVEVRQIDGNAQEVLRVADLAVVALGTATLETALMGTPAVLVGKVHPFTYWLAINFLALDLDYYSLINFIMGRCAYPELMQRNMTGPNIAQVVRELIASPRAMDTLRRVAGEVEAVLRKGQDSAGECEPAEGGDSMNIPPCASGRVATIASNMMN